LWKKYKRSLRKGELLNNKEIQVNNIQKSSSMIQGNGVGQVRRGASPRNKFNIDQLEEMSGMISSDLDEGIILFYLNIHPTLHTRT